MSDSLVLTGVKDVRKHTGTEMLRLNPKGGGDTFSLKRWWVEGGVSTCYEPCTVFDVTTADGTVKLALATKAEGSRVRIDHDGSFNFSFFGAGEISRACLFTDTFEVIEHYVFPSISGGKVMTVTPAGAASRPSGGSPATTIGSVVIAGSESVDDGDSESYTATAASATATPLAYAWSVSGDASITSGGSTATATIEYSYSGGSATIDCQVTSTDSGVTDSPADSNTLTITVAAPAPATGPADSVTLVGTTTTEGAGSVSGATTTSTNGSGLTVDYDSDGSVASNLTINAAGSGYQEGDSFTVDGDTGVTGTVSLTSTSSSSSGGGGY